MRYQASESNLNRTIPSEMIANKTKIEADTVQIG